MVQVCYLHFMPWLGNLDTGLKVKEKLLRTEMNFWRRDARTYRLLEVRNELKKKWR
jgi:hypothetical protein